MEAAHVAPAQGEVQARVRAFAQTIVVAGQFVELAFGRPDAQIGVEVARPHDRLHPLAGGTADLQIQGSGPLRNGAFSQALQEFVAQGRKATSGSNPTPPTSTPVTPTTESAP